MLYHLSYQIDGWDGWDRTSEMTESKSVALPLGYIPIRTLFTTGGGGQIRTAELVES